MMSEESRYKKAFSLLDINKNGRIEAREIQAIATYLGYRLQEKHIYKIITRFDSRECGDITYDEFVTTLRGQGEVVTEEEERRRLMQHKFDEYIREGEHYVTYDDVCRVLTQELGCAEPDMDSVLLQMNITKTTKLNFQDFALFYDKIIKKKEDVLTNFKEFDKDSKRFISMEDALLILGNMGFTDREVTSLFETHDRNRDNKLHYEEFVTFWGVLSEI